MTEDNGGGSDGEGDGGGAGGGGVGAGAGGLPDCGGSSLPPPPPQPVKVTSMAVISASRATFENLLIGSSFLSDVRGVLHPHWRFAAAGP